MNMKNIKQIREKIEKIDKQIITLLKKRLKLSEKIAREKIQNGLKILDTFREKELSGIYEKTAKTLGISEKFIQNLFRIIFKESRSKQKQSRQKIDDKAKK